MLSRRRIYVLIIGFFVVLTAVYVASVVASTQQGLPPRGETLEQYRRDRAISFDQAKYSFARGVLVWKKTVGDWTKLQIRIGSKSQALYDKDIYDPSVFEYEFKVGDKVAVLYYGSHLNWIGTVSAKEQTIKGRIWKIRKAFDFDRKGTFSYVLVELEREQVNYRFVVPSAKAYMFKVGDRVEVRFRFAFDPKITKL